MQPPTPGTRARAFAAAALAAAAFIGMDATIKLLAARYGTLQLSFFRFASGLAFAVPIWLWWRTPWPDRTQWRLHLLRSSLLLVTLTAYFHALSLLPLAQAVAMGYTAPIFTSLLAMLVLRERPAPWLWAALGCGVLGAGVALWPELAASGSPRLRGILIAAFAALVFAGVVVATRHQAQRDALPTFLLVQNLLPAAALAMPAGWDWRPVASPDWGLIALVGALATVGLASFTWALRHEEASRLAPVEYTGLLWAGLIGLAVFGEVPSAYTIGSALLIVAGCLLLLRR